MKAVRKIHFCAGHRVMNHESKCATLHGHNYIVWFYAEADSLDAIGRVIDFSVLKDKIGFWIDRFWDHNVIVYSQDTETVKAVKALPQKKKPFISRWNPTAENMAQYLLDEVCPQVLSGTGVKVTKIKLYETSDGEFLKK